MLVVVLVVVLAEEVIHEVLDNIQTIDKKDKKRVLKTYNFVSYVYY